MPRITRRKGRRRAKPLLPPLQNGKLTSFVPFDVRRMPREHCAEKVVGQEGQVRQCRFYAYPGYEYCGRHLVPRFRGNRQKQRCHAKAASGGRCKKWAVVGATVCPVHGAGYRRRVLEGEKHDPALVSIKHGRYSRRIPLQLQARLAPLLERLTLLPMNHAEDELRTATGLVALALQQERPCPHCGGPLPCIEDPQTLAHVVELLERVVRLKVAAAALRQADAEASD